MEIAITTTAMRAAFSDTIKRVQYGREHVKLTRRGRVVAVIVSTDEYARLSRVDSEPEPGAR